MLELMRKHATNWMIKILLGAIALAFALSWGVYNYGQRGRQVAIIVNGEEITATQVAQEQDKLTEQARAQFGAQLDKILPMLKLKERATESLVQKVLLFQAAQRLGIQVADSEVAARIARVPAFQRGGRFDLNLYHRILARNRLTPEGFEASTRNEILMEKLSSLIAGSAQVTPLEIQDAQVRELSQVKGAYKIFSSDEFRDKAKASPQAMQDYYQKHKSAFLIPTKVVLKYVVFPAEDYRDQAEINEEDIKDVYEMDRSKYFKPETVHARHILFKLPENPTPEQVAKVEKKAKAVLAEAQKPGADFAALARKYSQGPSAQNGGDLGEFTRGQMLPAFEKLVFDQLKPGQVGLVRTKFGWHVVKVVSHRKAQTTPLAKVRDQIKESLVARQTKDLASAAAERAFDLAAAGTPSQELAKKLHKDLTTSPEIIPGGAVEGLPGLEGLREALVDLEPGAVLPVLNYQDGAVLAWLEKRIPEKYKPLKEVEEQVRQAVLEQEASRLARKAAAELLAKLAKENDPAKALLAQPGARETGWLKRGGEVKDLNPSHSLVRALFMRPLKAPLLDQPVEAGGGYAAAALMARKAPDKQQLAETKEKFKEKLVTQKRRDLLNRFLQDLRVKAEIKFPAP